MNSNKVLKDKNGQIHEFLSGSIPVLILSSMVLLCLASQGYAEGQNYLSGIKSDVSATFGKNSDLPGYLYVAETLFAGFTWMKTKSPWVFVGLPLLMIFTHWGLSYVS